MPAGYAQAAEQLHKSQSSITYAVKKLESVLDITVFEIQGRKCTHATGELLYRRARALLDEACGLERAALSYPPAGRRRLA
jgi:DNA-binding transcriptional LysR family regulator